MRSVVREGVGQFDPADWDHLAREATPFLSHAFLAGLESTGCVGPGTGWNPLCLALEDEAGLAAVLPLYEKMHSYGEFVFDFAWAQAYSRSGLAYYPKLVAAVPFTPATGPRILTRPGPDRAALRARLVQAAQSLAHERGASSMHVLFPDAEDRDTFASARWLVRRDCQFHWRNRGYGTFDEYLDSFSAEKRKKARRERRRVHEAGVHFETWTGPDLDRARLDLVYALHRETFLRHGHEPYLTRAFFGHAARDLAGALIVKAALWHGELVACAVFFRSTTTLYGRYWGAAANFHSLHFETCYHQGIEYAIEQRLERFEPGTQGEHKVARGFEPTETWSAHYIADARFRSAIGEYLVREGAAVDDYAAEIRNHVPFRRGPRTARS
jgi:hypothetical protein